MPFDDEGPKRPISWIFEGIERQIVHETLPIEAFRTTDCNYARCQNMRQQIMIA